MVFIYIFIYTHIQSPRKGFALLPRLAKVSTTTTEVVATLRCAVRQELDLAFSLLRMNAYTHVSMYLM